MEIELSKILQYYASLCLLSIPIEAGLFTYLYKKTRFIVHLNDRIDRLLGLPPITDATNIKTQADEDTDESSDENSSKNDDKVKSNDVQGIASLRLQIGDIYYCRLSSVHRDSKMYELAWYSNNEFVGIVDDNAVFTADKTGVAIVGFERVGDNRDTGVDMYEINVMPTHRNWFADPVIHSIEKKEKRDIFLSRYAGVRVLSDDPQTNTVILDGNEYYSKLKVQFNVYGEVERVLYDFSGIRWNCGQDFLGEMKERFEQIRLSGEGISIWVRRLSNMEKDEVTLFAIIREYPDGKRYLGISRFWRENGEYEEFEMNIVLAEKIFSELLPGLPVAKVKPFRRRPTPRKHVHNPVLPATTAPAVTVLPVGNEESGKTEEKPADETGSSASADQTTIQEAPENTRDGEGQDEPAGAAGATGQTDITSSKQNGESDPDTGNDSDDNDGGTPDADDIPDIDDQGEDGTLGGEDTADFDADETAAIIEEME